VRRIALIAAALLCLSSAACLLPDNKPRISIEFGAVPELEGSEVVIDGKVAGKLERTGQATRISFPVSKGQHEVTLKSSQFDCETAHVNIELDAQKVRMLVDVGESSSLNGGAKPSIVFRY
jgi:hypothetical protein